MLLNENSFHEDVNQRKHFILQEICHAVCRYCSHIQKRDFQAVICHAAYEHPNPMTTFPIWLSQKSL
jgi:hypothetical protein